MTSAVTASDTLPSTTDQAATECTMETILGFLLPFFLAAAGGNPDTARAAIRQLIAAYNATTATELDLAGRIVGFSIAALDNLRLSMTPDLPDTKLLRYRANAVTLGRASDQARKVLAALRANPDQPLKTPRPAVAAAPEIRSPATRTPATSSPATRSPAASSPATPPVAAATCSASPDAVALAASASAPDQITTAAKPAQPPFALPTHGQSPLARGGPTNTPTDLEAMKRDARVLLNTFSRHGAPSSAAAIPFIAEPDAMARAAARAAVAAVRRSNPA